MNLALNEENLKEEESLVHLLLTNNRLFLYEYFQT